MCPSSRAESVTVKRELIDSISAISRGGELIGEDSPTFVLPWGVVRAEELGGRSASVVTGCLHRLQGTEELDRDLGRLQLEKLLGLRPWGYRPYSKEALRRRKAKRR